MTTVERCVHHWQLATPPETLARCKNCGEEREFRNYEEVRGAAVMREKAAGARRKKR